MANLLVSTTTLPGAADTSTSKTSKNNGREDFLTLLSSGKGILGNVSDQEKEAALKGDRKNRKADDALAAPVSLPTELFTVQKADKVDGVAAKSIDKEDTAPRAYKEQDNYAESKMADELAASKQQAARADNARNDKPARPAADAQGTDDAAPVQNTAATDSADAADDSAPVGASDGVDDANDPVPAAGQTPPPPPPFHGGDTISPGNLPRAIFQLLNEFFNHLTNDVSTGQTTMGSIGAFISALQHMLSSGIYPTNPFGAPPSAATPATGNTGTVDAAAGVPIPATDVPVDAAVPAQADGAAEQNGPSVIPLYAQPTTKKLAADAPVQLKTGNSIDDDRVIATTTADPITPKTKEPRGVITFTAAPIPQPVIPAATDKSAAKDVATPQVITNVATSIVQEAPVKIANANAQAIISTAVADKGDSQASTSGQGGQSDLGNSSGANSFLGGHSVGQSSSTASAGNVSFARALSQAQTPLSEQVLFHIKTALADGSSKIRIQLDPEHLGKLDIKLNVGADGKTGVMVTVDSKDTLALLQRDSHGLQQALADAGLKTDSGSLSFNLRQQHNASDHTQHAALNYQKQIGEDDDLPLDVISRSYVINMAEGDGVDIKI